MTLSTIFKLLIALAVLNSCGTDDSALAPSPSATPASNVPSVAENKTSPAPDAVVKDSPKTLTKQPEASSAPASLYSSLESVVTRRFETNLFIFNLHDVNYMLSSSASYLSYPGQGTGSYSKVTKKKPDGTTVLCWTRVTARIPLVEGRADDAYGVLEMKNLMSSQDAFCGSTNSIYTYKYRITASQELVMEYVSTQSENPLH